VACENVGCVLLARNPLDSTKWSSSTQLLFGLFSVLNVCHSECPIPFRLLIPQLDIPKMASPNSNSLVSPIKSESEHVERLDIAQTHETYYEKDEIAALSTEHRDYLKRRHGTLDLDPVPAFGDADPYNWPTWKVSKVEV
jgi:hypothetical protein